MAGERLPETQVPTCRPGDTVLSGDFVFRKIGQPIRLLSGHSSFDISNIPVQALAISEGFGVIFVANSEGFCVARTNDTVDLAKRIKEAEQQLSVRDISISNVSFGHVSILSLSTNSSFLAACSGAEIKLFSVSSILRKDCEPISSFSIGTTCHIKVFIWRNSSESSFFVLSSDGDLYGGTVGAPLKETLKKIDAVGCSVLDDSFVVAQFLNLSIRNSDITERFRISIPLAPFVDDNSCKYTIKVDSLHWVRQDSIVIGCLQLSDSGDDQAYFVQVLTSGTGEFVEASCKPSIVFFSELFSCFTGDIFPGVGPYLFVSHLESWNFALVANRKNSDQHVVSIGWLFEEHDEAVTVEFRQDKDRPQIGLTDTGDDNLLVGFGIDRVSVCEKIELVISDEDRKEILPHCILMCITSDEKLAMFYVARVSDVSAAMPHIVTPSRENEENTAAFDLAPLEGDKNAKQMGHELRFGLGSCLQQRNMLSNDGKGAILTIQEIHAGTLSMIGDQREYFPPEADATSFQKCKFEGHSNVNAKVSSQGSESGEASVSPRESLPQLKTLHECSKQSESRIFYNVVDMISELDGLLSHIDGKGGFMDACMMLQKDAVLQVEIGLDELSRDLRTFKCKIDEQLCRDAQYLKSKMAQVLARKSYIDSLLKQIVDAKYWELFHGQMLCPEYEVKVHRMEELHHVLVRQIINLGKHFNSLELDRFDSVERNPVQSSKIYQTSKKSRDVNSFHSLYNTMSSLLSTAEQLSEHLSKQMSSLDICAAMASEKHNVKRELFESIGLTHDGDLSESIREFGYSSDSPRSLTTSLARTGKESKNKDTSITSKSHGTETSRRRRDSLDMSWSRFEPQKTIVKRTLPEEGHAMLGVNKPFSFRGDLIDPLSTYSNAGAHSIPTTPKKSGDFALSTKEKGWTSVQLRSCWADHLVNSLGSHCNLSEIHKSKNEDHQYEQASCCAEFSVCDSSLDVSSISAILTEVPEGKLTLHLQSPVASQICTEVSHVLASHPEKAKSAGSNKSSRPGFSIGDFGSLGALDVDAGQESVNISNVVLTPPALLKLTDKHQQVAVPNAEEGKFQILSSDSSSIGCMDFDETRQPRELLSAANFHPSLHSAVSQPPSSCDEPSQMTFSIASSVQQLFASDASENACAEASLTSILSVSTGVQFHSPQLSIPSSSSIFSSEVALSVGASTSRIHPEVEDYGTAALPAAPAGITETTVNFLPSDKSQSVSTTPSVFSSVDTTTVVIDAQSEFTSARAESTTAGSLPLPSPPSIYPEKPFIPISEALSQNSQLDGRIMLESGVCKDDEMDEAPEATVELGLSSFGLGSVPLANASKQNPFGAPIAALAGGFPAPSMTVASGVLFRPASFSFQSGYSAQPSQLANQGACSSTSDSGTTPNIGAFVCPGQLGPGQQALGSVLGAFGQSRQLGTGLPSAGQPLSSSFGGGFSGTLAGGGFASLASGSGGFAGLASGGGGFAAAASSGGYPASSSVPASGGFAAFGSMIGSGGFSFSSGNISAGKPPELFTQMRK